MLKYESNGAKCMSNLKYLVGAQKSKFSKPLFMGMRAFMHVAKKGDAFLIYVLLATNARSQQHEISSQYKGYRDVFEKKNLNIYHNINHMCRNPNLAKCGGEAQHLEKLGIWSPPGLPNVQSSTAGAKTPRIGVFLMSLKRS